ncbi:hypothetical protein QOT17_009174 [Balamuthia mandrillaris]
MNIASDSKSMFNKGQAGDGRNLIGNLQISPPERSHQSSGMIALLAGRDTMVGVVYRRDERLKLRGENSPMIAVRRFPCMRVSLVQRPFGAQTGRYFMHLFTRFERDILWYGLISELRHMTSKLSIIALPPKPDSQRLHLAGGEEPLPTEAVPRCRMMAVQCCPSEDDIFMLSLHSGGRERRFWISSRITYDIPANLKHLEIEDDSVPSEAGDDPQDLPPNLTSRATSIDSQQCQRKRQFHRNRFGWRRALRKRACILPHKKQRMEERQPFSLAAGQDEDLINLANAFIIEVLSTC